MIILGIESSCDDTSVALLDCTSKGFFVLKEITASQIEIHKKYGGVVPEVAGRMHAEKIVPLIEEVLKNQPKPDSIVVSSGPGLITGLIVGVESARTLSYSLDIPLVSVNHLEGHIHSVEIGEGGLSAGRQEIKYPALALIASGGHTELVLMKKQGKYQVLGKTRDDAAGECFDKVAKLLDLPYPGGPQISKLGKNGNSKAIDLPRPMLVRRKSEWVCNESKGGLNRDNFDFSFSGLKTACLYYLQKNPLCNKTIPDCHPELDSGSFSQGNTKKDSDFRQNDSCVNKNDFCASFEQAVTDVLVKKTIKAALKHKPKTVILGGGVSANKKLRVTLEKEIQTNLENTKLLLPNPKYSMDNASMIAVAGYYKAKKKKFTKWNKIDANPNWEL